MTDEELDRAVDELARACEQVAQRIDMEIVAGNLPYQPTRNLVMRLQAIIANYRREGAHERVLQ